MPTYKYHCVDCSESKIMIFEINAEHTIPLCPKCEKPMVRLFGLQTIRFIGSGWGKDPK
jgi:putative FmdB family regulatory protein